MRINNDQFLIAEAYRSIYEQALNGDDFAGIKQHVQKFLDDLSNGIESNPQMAVGNHNIKRYSEEWRNSQNIQQLDLVARKIAMVVPLVIEDLANKSQFQSAQKWLGTAQAIKERLKDKQKQFTAEELSTFIPAGITDGVEDVRDVQTVDGLVNPVPTDKEEQDIQRRRMDSDLFK